MIQPMNKLFCFILLFATKNCLSQRVAVKPSVGVNSSVYLVSSTRSSIFKIGYQASFDADIHVAKRNYIEGSMSYKFTKGDLRRTFVYPTSPSPGDAPQVREDFNCKSVQLTGLYLRKLSEKDCFFYAIGLGINFQLDASRNGVATLAGFTEYYSTKFRLESKNGGRTGCVAKGSLGKYLWNDRFIARLNLDWSVSNWYYPTNEILEKVGRYRVRPYGFSVEIGYVF
jgi:hypothetical protein